MDVCLMGRASHRVYILLGVYLTSCTFYPLHYQYLVQPYKL
jgi:hypothetical protein